MQSVTFPLHICCPENPNFVRHLKNRCHFSAQHESGEKWWCEKSQEIYFHQGYKCFHSSQLVTQRARGLLELFCGRRSETIFTLFQYLKAFRLIIFPAGFQNKKVGRIQKGDWSISQIYFDNTEPLAFANTNKIALDPFHFTASAVFLRCLDQT